MNIFDLLFPKITRFYFLTRQKPNDYPEVVASDRIRYVVLACEEGGRWGPDVFEVVSDLVRLEVWAPQGSPPLGQILADADIGPEPSRVV